MKQPGDTKFIITTVFRKIAETVLLLIILSLLVFALMYIAPGDPAEKRLTSQGTAITKEVLEAERARLGLMRPFLVFGGISESPSRTICLSHRSLPPDFRRL